MQFDRLAFVDVETTGGSAQYDRIIEIGVLRIENVNVVKKYTTLVDPDHHVPKSIEDLTGIQSKDLETAPSFYDISQELLEILRDCTFVAHNVRFDYSFIKAEFKRIGIDFHASQLCTVRLSRAISPSERHHNLDTVMQRYAIRCKNRHRAFDDAHVLWKFYKKIQKTYGKDTLATILASVTQKASLPSNLPMQSLAALPKGPGVYIFYGEQGMPLYIGKSINLRARVLSHFANDLTSPVEMKIAQQIVNIETIETSGELSALIREAELIKKMQPLYNRRLRHARTMLSATSFIDEQGYMRVSVQEVSEIEAHELDSLLGTFKSKRQAEEVLRALAKEFTLCNKLLGTEKTDRQCFGYSLNKCKGGCIGAENPTIYNLRFAIAFQKMKLQKWPYGTPILLFDTNDGAQANEAFLIDKWCYLGKVSLIGGSYELTSTHQGKFDQDMYKILRSFINNPKNRHKIKAFDLEALGIA